MEHWRRMAASSWNGRKTMEFYEIINLVLYHWLWKGLHFLLSMAPCKMMDLHLPHHVIHWTIQFPLTTKPDLDAFKTLKILGILIKATILYSGGRLDPEKHKSQLRLDSHKKSWSQISKLNLSMLRLLKGNIYLLFFFYKKVITLERRGLCTCQSRNIVFSFLGWRAEGVDPLPSNLNCDFCPILC